VAKRDFIPFQRVSIPPVAATSSRPSASRRCSVVPGKIPIWRRLRIGRRARERLRRQAEVLCGAVSDNKNPRFAGTFPSLEPSDGLEPSTPSSPCHDRPWLYQRIDVGPLSPRKRERRGRSVNFTPRDRDPVMPEDSPGAVVRRAGKHTRSPIDAPASLFRHFVRSSVELCKRRQARESSPGETWSLLAWTGS
jgi:hypothetical protein